MAASTEPRVARCDADQVPALLDDLSACYADAYGAEPRDEKISAFRSRAAKALGRPGFELVVAMDLGAAVGFAFGYPLPPDTVWWEGLEPAPTAGFTVEDGSRTFTLAEIEVRRGWQGRGVGRRLHDELLGGRPEQRATLATGPSADAARALYERWGWQRVGTVPGTPGMTYFDLYVLYVLDLPLGVRP